MEHRLRLLQPSGRKAARAGQAGLGLSLDQNSKKFGSNHPSTFCSKLYIPSTINTWIRLWYTKLVSRALANFDPKKDTALHCRTETYTSNAKTAQKPNATRFIWVFIVLCMYNMYFARDPKLLLTNREWSRTSIAWPLLLLTWQFYNALHMYYVLPCSALPPYLALHSMASANMNKIEKLHENC